MGHGSGETGDLPTWNHKRACLEGAGAEVSEWVRDEGVGRLVPPEASLLGL